MHREKEDFVFIGGGLETASELKLQMMREGDDEVEREVGYPHRKVKLVRKRGSDLER